MKFKCLLTSATLCIVPFSSAIASEGLNSGDTAWIIVSTALVMMMTPAGLALFYGGLSRYKNLLNTFAMTIVAYCLTSVIWMMWGYTLAFGPDKAGIVGGLSNLFMAGIGVGSLSGSIPTYVFALFQMTFACITVALVLGSIVDRMKFSSWIVFTILWITFIYCPIAHWVWGGGWMGNMGALDFAGGTVVHINAGVAGLVLSLVLGKRIGYGKDAMFPSSIALTALGAALLWFGWFGFNAGSQLAADGIAGQPFWLPTPRRLSEPWPGCLLNGWWTRSRPFWVWHPESSPDWSPSPRRPDLSICRRPCLSDSVPDCLVFTASQRSSKNSAMMIHWMPSAYMACAGSGEQWPPDYLPIRRSTKPVAAYFTAIRNSSGSKLFQLLPQQYSPPSARL